MQALATLGALGALDEATLSAALTDPHPWVRCAALRESEAFPVESLFPAVAALARDPDPAVLLQAAFTLGFWPPERSEPVLAELSAHPDEDVRVAVMSSLRPDSPLFHRLKQKEVIPAAVRSPVLQSSSPDREKVIATYAAVEKLSGNAAAGQPLLGAALGAAEKVECGAADGGLPIG